MREIKKEYMPKPGEVNSDDPDDNVAYEMQPLLSNQQRMQCEEMVLQFDVSTDN